MRDCIKIFALCLLLCFVQDSHQLDSIHNVLMDQRICDYRMAKFCFQLRGAVSCNVTLVCDHCKEFSRFVPTDIKSMECILRINETESSFKFKKVRFHSNSTCIVREFRLPYKKFVEKYPALNSFVKVGDLEMNPKDFCPMFGFCCPPKVRPKVDVDEALVRGRISTNGPAGFVKIYDGKRGSRSAKVVEKLSKMMFIALLITFEFAKISFVFSRL